MKKDKNAVRITELEQKISELTAGWQRTQADFQNFRRQTEEDRKKLIESANIDFMMQILPVLDNFQLAAKHAPKELENNNWAEGVKQIERQLENILSSEGLQRIATSGEEFNPYFHEAIEHVISSLPENEVVEEISAGYTFGDTVIRPAKVKVSSGQKSKSGKH